MGLRVRHYLFFGIFVLTALMLWLHYGAVFSKNKTEQKAEDIANKVEKKAKQTETTEGKNNLFKDNVRVKTNNKGEPIVEQIGEASWYGKGFHGKKTASGETFNQHDFTAAHPTLPLGTEATVTNLETGKSVELKINDRGPYSKGRAIDLSKEAAKEIGMKKDGVISVKIEAKVSPEDE
jgi:rare lipoprotein A (peptidoglycan hydrolase)